MLQIINGSEMYLSYILKIVAQTTGLQFRSSRPEVFCKEGVLRNFLRTPPVAASVQLWKSKARVTSYEFKSMNYEFKSTSYEFKSTSYELQVQIYELRVQILELPAQIHRIGD